MHVEMVCFHMTILWICAMISHLLINHAVLWFTSTWVKSILIGIQCSGDRQTNMKLDANISSTWLASFSEFKIPKKKKSIFHSLFSMNQHLWIIPTFEVVSSRIPVLAHLEISSEWEMDLKVSIEMKTMYILWVQNIANNLLVTCKVPSELPDSRVISWLVKKIPSWSNDKWKTLVKS